ncbi:hypothetical protein [Reichenbachiella ulvae]|uniref:PH domain-containing protein n=1 Tax=Reichenbachiella ulvae TaxID=2980104 RepID=A0ABT3CTM8_9BACT|nr:hypothetical protein [Reichenbachiella ulvae]MCV9386987.1 hypothetical protein [Reichenbachiella ulvae]
MNVKSKQSIILYFAVFLLAFGSGVLLFIAWIIIRTNIEDLLRLDIISGTLFLIWIGLLPLILVGEHLRGIVIREDHLELSYLFGLFRTKHYFTNLKQNQYWYHNEGVVVETESGYQFTLGQKQYRNYSELRNLIDEKIDKSDELTLRRFTRTLKILTVSGVIILTAFVISLNV